jgi:hypothetical protein
MPDHKSNDRDELDLLLDSALATYADPGPSPNLRSRILPATTQRRRGELLAGWTIWAVPALAAMLAVVILIERHEHGKRTDAPISVRLSPIPHAPQLARQEPIIHSPVTKLETTRDALHTNLRRTPTTISASTSKPEGLPKEEVFPTPTPLSPQEQAVVSLVNRDSPDSKDLAQQLTRAAPQGQPTEPLRIAAIHIPPLNPPDNGNN